MSVFRNVLFGVGFLAALLTLGSLLGRLHWTLDVLSHFHIQYTALLLVAVPALLLMRRRWQGLVLLPALLVNLFLLIPFFIADEPSSAADNAEPLRVLSMNISTSTAGYPQVVELIRQREPDLVFLSEVREDLVALLQAELTEAYPVQYAEPSRHTLGLAILSRDPAVEVQTVSAGDAVGRMGRRYLRADFLHEGVPVTLVGIHPLPPMREAWALGRDREIALMGEVATETDHPFILAGDLNTSPWSRAMHALVRDTGLRYASDGHGIWTTWFLGPSLLGPLLGAPPRPHSGVA